MVIQEDLLREAAHTAHSSLLQSFSCALIYASVKVKLQASLGANVLLLYARGGGIAVPLQQHLLPFQ